jgi:hypothetical protein
MPKQTGKTFQTDNWEWKFTRNYNYNRVRVTNFATSKNLPVESTMFPHRNIINMLGHIKIGKPTFRLTIF